MSRLAEYEAARDALLARLVHLLQADSRVVAVWLAGSLGRDEGDAWADCDLTIVIDDAELEAFLEDRPRLYQSLGEVLLVQDEIPGQPDIGDTFNLIHFSSALGPIELDLSFVPFARARKPAGHKSLLERRDVPVEPVAVLTNSEVTLFARRWNKFFWAMAPIAVKFAGRGDTRRAAAQIDLLTRALISLWRLVDEPHPTDPWRPDSNRPLEEELHHRLPLLPSVISPAGALEHILTLCSEAEALQPQLGSLNAAVNPPIISATRRLADLARETILAGPSPRRGYR